MNMNYKFTTLNSKWRLSMLAQQANLTQQSMLAQKYVLTPKTWKSMIEAKIHT